MCEFNFTIHLKITKGKTMKDLLGAIVIHLAIAILLGWLLIEIIS